MRTTAKHVEGALYQMDRWSLRVPPGMPGADQLASGAPTWVVVDKPAYATGLAPGAPTLTLHAVAVVPEIFP